METSLENIVKGRKVYLWGQRRYINDFKYMFDKLKVDGLLIKEDSFEKIIPGEALVIACSFEKDQILNIMHGWGLNTEKDLIFAEDLFYLLDDYRFDIVNGRKIAMWGIGDTCKNSLQQINDNGYSIDIALFIDSNIKKHGSFYYGRKVYHFSFLESVIENYFIIVASVFYEEIKSQLESFGLKENQDFLPYSALSSKPSSLLRQTICAPQIKGMFCLRPFFWFYYAWFGNYCCCSTWVKYPIGNAIADTPQASWHSTVAKLYRLSMLNRTFCFCKENVCPKFDNNAKEVFQEIPSDYSKPEILTLGLDYSCNLHCVSCRDEVKIVKGAQFDLRKNMAKKIIDTGWLQTVKKLELCGSGEALYSKVYESILFDSITSQRHSISLLTNGTLLNKTRWESLKKVYRTIDVNISVDAAFENTYRNIRRGGNWTHLMDNLHMLSQLRKKGELNYLEIRMVVQKANYQEMSAFVEMGRRLEVDKVVFTRLLNWDSYSAEEFENVSMVNSSGYIKPELQEILKDPIFLDNIVVLDEFIKHLRRGLGA